MTRVDLLNLTDLDPRVSHSFQTSTLLSSMGEILGHALVHRHRNGRMSSGNREATAARGSRLSRQIGSRIRDPATACRMDDSRIRIQVRVYPPDVRRHHFILQAYTNIH